MVSCDGQRAVVDERGALVGRPAVRQQRLGDRANLPRSGVADERPRQSGEPRPVDVRRRVGFALVAAHERQRVAGAGIRHRNARVGQARRSRRGCRARPRTGCPARAGTALPCRRCRTRTGRPTSAGRPSCPRALSRRAESRSRPGRAASAPPVRRRSARRRAREAQQPPVDAVVVDDDVRRLQAALPAHADERRIAGAGADDVDTRSIHSCLRLHLDYDRIALQQLASALCIQCVGEPAAEPSGSPIRPLIERRDRSRPVERRDDGIHHELAILLARQGAERQLAAAAERGHDAPVRRRAPGRPPRRAMGADASRESPRRRSRISTATIP